MSSFKKNFCIIVILILSLAFLSGSAGSGQVQDSPRGDGRIYSRDYGEPSQSTLQAIKDFIGSNVREVSLHPGVWTISSKFSAPANLVLRPAPGAVLNVNIPDLHIAGLRRAEACVVTWSNHGLAARDIVYFSGITQTGGWTALNGHHAITKIDDNSFSIPVNTSGYASDYKPSTDPGVYSQTLYLQSFDAGTYQCLDAAPGKVIFGPGAVKEVYPQWWGAREGGENATYIQAAGNSIPITGGVTLRLPESLYAATVVIDKPDVIIDSGYKSQSWSASYVQAASDPDYRIYNTMFVVKANNVNFQNTTFRQGAFTHSGMLIWFAQGVNGGDVYKCRFYDLAYDGGNTYGACVQCRSGTNNIKTRECYFENCKAAVVIQGNKSSITGNVSINNNTNGGTDSMFSLDGGGGNSMAYNQVYKAQICPISGNIYQISCNTNNFTVDHNYLQGLKGGVGFHFYALNGFSPSNGIVAYNIVEGGGLKATGPYCMMRIEPGCTGFEISHNKFENAVSQTPHTSGAMEISPSNHKLVGNEFLLGTTGELAWAIRILPATTPGYLDIFNNTIQTTSRGIYFDGFENNNNNMIPIKLKGNTYDHMLAPISGNGFRRDFPLRMENDYFTGPNVGKFGPPVAVGNHR